MSVLTIEPSLFIACEAFLSGGSMGLLSAMGALLLLFLVLSLAAGSSTTLILDWLRFLLSHVDIFVFVLRLSAAGSPALTSSLRHVLHLLLFSAVLSLGERFHDVLNDI